MKKLTLISDVHKNFDAYKHIIGNMEDDEESIQLGDMGIGFPKGTGSSMYSPTKTIDDEEELSNILMDERHKFIRGNHDNPSVCREHPNYLGDYGVYQDEIFFISGAWSLDRWERIQGVDWWEDEELSYEELQNAVDLYEDSFPRLVISHECPRSISKLLHPALSHSTITGNVMDRMLDVWRPSIWVFGHHHMSKQFNIGGTQFICLDTLQKWTWKNR